MVWSGCAGRIGALLTSVTTIVKVFVALKGGEPSSVTTVVNRLVLGPWACEGMQGMSRLAEIVALAGPTSKVYVNVFAGRSESVAVLVTTNPVNSAIVWSGWAGSTGGLFTSVTTTAKVLVALRG